ncbi:alpha/beta fold hydrolase [Hahella sp. HN01]|uniref:alpha/beta fold hydrolase n=1 Tax=Hahella sp. HN01 TaxID=2847262 RepID=UPI001C1F1F13|nr:alpha/beta fold hydrolase [Hahella sp. HN01]MBU6952103.1 alpha/beta fold hydrolase [Hahella sp. HN01]
MDDQWINREEYPFTSHYIELGPGRMHYVDEGQGKPIVMLHGNPTWSFLYRNMIKGLSGQYRCIVPDHLGFGLSDKPRNWSYLPQDHARNLETLIRQLDLQDVTLVVQDWGGPIGLSYALNNPHNVRRLVIMNTWMWSAHGDVKYETFSALMGGLLGRFMIKRFNVFVSVLLKQAVQKKLSADVYKHYSEPLKNPAERKGCWVFPKQIIKADEWLEELWEKRANIADIPALLLWGMKDFAFQERELRTWMQLLNHHTAVTFDDAGHFLPEDKGAEVCPLIADFLRDAEPTFQREASAPAPAI